MSEKEFDISSGSGKKVVGAPSGFSMDRLIDTSEAARFVDIHEASGIRLSLDFDPTKIARISLETISENEGEFEGDFLAIPSDEAGKVKLLPLDKVDRLLDWIADIGRGDNALRFEPETAEEVVLAEQLTGIVLVATNTPSYLSIVGGEQRVESRLYYKDLFSTTGRSIESPLLLGERTAGNVPDEMLEHIYGGAKYRINGLQGNRIVSRSTLALIDAGVQAAKLSGLQEMSIAALLAVVYQYEGFSKPFEEPEYYQYCHMYVTRGQIVTDLISRWDTELGIEKDEAVAGIDIKDEIAIRKVDLEALVALYGSMTQVELLPAFETETKAVAIPEVTANLLPSKTGAQLLAELNEQDRVNVDNYSRVIASVIETRVEDETTVSEIVAALVESGVISHDIATVHGEEFEHLVGEGVVLTRAKLSMQASGLETTELEEGFRAKLIEFVVRNADAMRRTQQLAPEVGVNFDALMKIIERTRLHGRSTKDVAHILGQIVTAQERMLWAAFPALVAGLRANVSDELGITLRNPEYAYADNSGATLFVSTKEEADLVATYVRHLLEEAGLDKTIPVEVSQRGSEDGLYVKVGSDALGKTIPEEARLPAGQKHHRAGPKGS